VIASQTLPTIPTSRVHLRWLEARDVPALFEIFGDPETVRYWSRPPLLGVAEATEMLASIHRQFAEKSLFQWGIATNEDDRAIGTCSLFGMSIPHRRAELGFAIHRSHWRKGYASEAAGALVRFAFETLDLHRLEADVDPRNGASIRCLESLGFKREGYARERYHLLGELQDSVQYGVLRREWSVG
jgi:[ribosomal protein S5]-alanine N-acetyltransferase